MDSKRRDPATAEGLKQLYSVRLRRQDPELIEIEDDSDPPRPE